jgi:hypothetical protein
MKNYKRLFTAALATVMALSSIVAMSANAYSYYTDATDNEGYKAHIESLNNSEKLTPELAEYMHNILYGIYSPPNVKNAWRTSKSASDDGRKFSKYVIEYTYNDVIWFKFDLSDEETENALETLKDELGYNDNLTFTKKDSSTYNSPRIKISFSDDNHKLNIMIAEKAYSILKEKYPVTIGQSMFDIHHFITVRLQNCITNVDEKHHMDMTEQEKKDFYDSIDHDYIKENFRATIDITNGIRIYFPDDVTEEEWLGCWNYLIQNHNAVVHQYYETSDSQYTGEADFSEISYVDGDANRDKITTIADAAAIFQSLANPDKYKLSAQGEFNADSKGDGITVDDAVRIQKKLAGITE